MRAEEYLRDMLKGITNSMKIIALNKYHDTVDLVLETGTSEDLKELHIIVSVVYVLHDGSVLKNKYVRYSYQMSDWTDSSMDKAFMQFTQYLVRCFMYGKEGYNMGDLLKGKAPLVDYDNKTIKEIIDERKIGNN